MKYSWAILGITVVVAAVGYGRYHQYPLPNPSAQRQRAQCVRLFVTRPSQSRTVTFLKNQAISYNQLSNSEIFEGNTATDFQRQHQKEVGSEIAFRIADIQKPLCGRSDALFVVSFDHHGQLLKVEDMDSNFGCLDF